MHLLLAAVCALPFLNSLSLPFVLDDQGAVIENASIRDLTNWSAVLLPPPEISTSGRPIVSLSLAVNYALDGIDAWSYHAVNLGVHLACALVLFGLVRRTLRMMDPGRHIAAPDTFALVTAAIWTVHPLNTEVIDYVTQRSESLMALFYLLTLYAAARALAASRSGWPLAAVVFCALGMACKESMATAPAAVLLYDRSFAFGTFRDAIRTRWRLYLGLAATWGLVAWLTAAGPRSQSAGFSSGVDPWTYLLNQAQLIPAYLWRALWPRDLVAVYGWPAPLGIADVWMPALLVLSLLAVTGWLLVTRPRLGFLCAWFFLTLAPTSSVIPIATEVGAERRMYLPLMSLVLLTLAAIHDAGRRLVRRAPGRARAVRVAGVVAAALIVLLLSARTYARNEEYRSGVRLARLNLARWPSPIGHEFLAQQLLLAGEREEGLAELKAAIPGAPRSYHQLGFEQFQAGQLADAVVSLSEYCARMPRDQGVPDARLLLAQTYQRLQRWPDAIEQGRLVIGMRPEGHPQAIEAHGVIADALRMQEQYAAAVAEYQAFLKVRPENGDAWRKLGIAFVGDGRIDEAAAAFQRDAELRPNDVTAHKNVMMALFDAGRIDAGLDRAQRVLALVPRDVDTYLLVASTLEGQGRREEARRYADMARKLGAPAAGP